MQDHKDIFSKLVASKTVILTIIVCFLVIYAVISSIMIFANSDNVLSSIAQIIAPLGIIGIATVISVDCFYKMASDKTIVKVFSLITLALGIIVVILLTLIIWEIIPAYEKSGYGYFSYYSTPTVAYKLTMALLSIVGFTFLASIVLNTKENHKLIHISKYITTGFLAIACLISVIGNFVDFSQDTYGSTRMGLFQAVSWITAIALGATVIYLSKTIDWEARKNKSDELEPQLPGKKQFNEQSFEVQATLEQPAPEQIAVSINPTPEPPVDPTPEQPIALAPEQPVVSTPEQPITPTQEQPMDLNPETQSTSTTSTPNPLAQS